MSQPLPAALAAAVAAAQVAWDAYHAAAKADADDAERYNAAFFTPDTADADTRRATIQRAAAASVVTTRALLAAAIAVHAAAETAYNAALDAQREMLDADADLRLSINVAADDLYWELRDAAVHLADAAAEYHSALIA